VLGGVLVLGAAIGTACGPLAGRAVDRHGALVVARAAGLGMALTPAFLVLDPPRWAVLAALVTTNPLFTFLGAAVYGPATEGAERLGLGLGAAYGVLSIAWAVGYAVGPPAAAGLADAVGEQATYAATAAGAVALVVVALRRASVADWRSGPESARQPA